MNFLSSLEPLIVVIHILICVFLIAVILLQAGKGADAGVTFGAGGSQSMFGARGAQTFLAKITTIVAISFLVTSITLAAIHRSRVSGMGGKSVITEEMVKEKAAEQPAEPAAPAVPEAPKEAPKQ